MNRRILALALAGLLCLSLVPSLLNGAVKLPVPEKIALDNGLTVYYLHNPELPLVSLRMFVAGAGSAYDPAALEGLAGLTAELMLKGNASQNAEAIAEELDFMGAGLNVAAADEYAQISAGSLVEHFPRVLEIATACLAGPTFPEEEFARERPRRVDALAAIKDNPRQAVRLYFRKAYFGSHPLGRLSSGTESSLNKITGRDIVGFYRERYRPDRCLAAVVGDIDRAKLEGLLQATLGRWTKPSAPAPALDLPPLPVPKGKTLLLVDKPDATQAYFVLGAPGYAVGDPVDPAASVMNTLFGGRFTSWLNTELRIKRGLTYGAGSNFQTWKKGGLFSAASYTKNDKIGEMLDITLGLFGQAKNKGFTATEVESARNYILGMFPLSLEENADKAEALLQLAFYGLSFDTMDRFLASVEKVSAQLAGQTAAKLLPRQDFVLVVVGKAAEIRPLLQKFGTFLEKKISDPGF